MFDERNDIWIRLFKGMTILEFFGAILSGIIVAIIVEAFWVFLVGVASAFVIFVINMVLVQFFTNVQTIRERMEAMEASAQKTNHAAVGGSAQTSAYTQMHTTVSAPNAAPVGTAVTEKPPVTVSAAEKCPVCGAEYVGDLPFCKKCGTPKNMPKRQEGWKCPSCDFLNRPTAPFCKRCGKPK
jgi:hypothetical protein